VPNKVAVGQEPAARALPRAGMPVGAPAVAPPEVAGQAAVQVEMPAYRLRAATAWVGIYQEAGARGPETAPATG